MEIQGVAKATARGDTSEHFPLFTTSSSRFKITRLVSVCTLVSLVPSAKKLLDPYGVELRILNLRVRGIFLTVENVRRNRVAVPGMSSRGWMAFAGVA